LIYINNQIDTTILFNYLIFLFLLDLSQNPSEFLIENFDNAFDNLNLGDEIEDNNLKNSDINITGMNTNISISGLNRSQVFNQNQNRPINQKKKLLICEIKQSVDVFIKDYNNYFFYNFFSKIFGNLKTVIDEKNGKKEEISENYNLQIKEMENLLNEG
jgi:hypothetical protein